MGICLDTEKNNETEDTENSGGNEPWISRSSRNFGYPITPPEGKFSMQNNVPVKFERPKVPVIFILGGPGSGKVTHCDNLSEEKRGIIHINMMDLLQQYSVGNETQNFNELSSKTVTEVLMLEMKMSPAAKTFLVSGYPRNMRDVVEYHDKIQTVNGVILLAWRQNMLERQVEYGVKLGHVIMQFARMELTNFFQNVTSVADYFDQRNMLIVINGERNPAEVYNDFRAAVLRILTMKTSAVIENYESAPIRIPNGDVLRSLEDRPVITVVKEVGSSSELTPSTAASNPIDIQQVESEKPNPSAAVTAQRTIVTDMKSLDKITSDKIPGIVFVLGGPGSNKATLCKKVLQRMPGWSHDSLGSSFRNKVSSGELSVIDAQNLRDTIAIGEMMDMETVSNTIDAIIANKSDSKGLVIDGFPRSIDQLYLFERRYDQHPPVILLDCSKLSIGRNRWDDNVNAFRKRLELFREFTLPLLRLLDAEHRLTTVDGDTETPEVQEEFAITLIDAIQHVEEDLKLGTSSVKDSRRSSLNIGAAALLQDLEDDEDNTQRWQPTRVQHMMNGFGPPRERSDVNTGAGFNYKTNRNITATIRTTTNKNNDNINNNNNNNNNINSRNIIRTRAQIESYPMENIN